MPKSGGNPKTPELQQAVEAILKADESEVENLDSDVLRREVKKIRDMTDD